MFQQSREAKGAGCWECCLRTSSNQGTRWVTPDLLLLLLCFLMSRPRSLACHVFSLVRLQASQSSKHSLASDRSQLKPRSGSSSSSFDVYVAEARKVVLTSSGQHFLGSDHPDAESIALESRDARHLLDLKSGPAVQVWPVHSPAHACFMCFNCDLLLQVLAQMIQCCLMNPCHQRKCCLYPSMQRTFISI